MWLKYFSALLFVVSQLFSSAYARDIALAFDDTLARASSLDGSARTKMLISGMARADVKQAMFLVNSKNITANTVERMMHYDATGQLIVNAGHSYSLLHRAKNYGFPIDIMKANAALELYANYHQHITHPYLYGGGDAVLVQQLQRYLAEHNYLPIYITTQVHDQYMNRLYQQRIASGRSVDIRALEKAYVNMIVDKVLAYDASAYLRLGASPRQVLLLHENDLAAYCIMGLIDALTAQGFKVIAPEKVFSDPVLNPYFSSQFSANLLTRYLTGLPAAKREWPYLATQQDQEKIHTYLRAQGLDYLITP
jgi:peptidoglycan-N-acetylglucosamine deacetylase